MVRLTFFTRLFAVLAACTALVALVGAKPMPNPTRDITFYDKRSHLEKRLTVGTVCATVPVTVIGNAITPIIVSGRALDLISVEPS